MLGLSWIDESIVVEVAGEDSRRQFEELLPIAQVDDSVLVEIEGLALVLPLLKTGEVTRGVHAYEEVVVLFVHNAIAIQINSLRGALPLLKGNPREGRLSTLTGLGGIDESIAVEVAGIGAWWWLLSALPGLGGVNNPIAVEIAGIGAWRRLRSALTSLGGVDESIAVEVAGVTTCGRWLRSALPGLGGIDDAVAVEVAGITTCGRRWRSTLPSFEGVDEPVAVGVAGVLGVRMATHEGRQDTYCEQNAGWPGHCRTPAWQWAPQAICRGAMSGCEEVGVRHRIHYLIVPIRRDGAKSVARLGCGSGRSTLPLTQEAKAVLESRRGAAIRHQILPPIGYPGQFPEAGDLGLPALLPLNDLAGTAWSCQPPRGNVWQCSPICLQSHHETMQPH